MKVISKQKISKQRPSNMVAKVILAVIIVASMFSIMIPSKVYAGQQTAPNCDLSTASGVKESDDPSTKCKIEVNDCKESSENTNASNCRIVYYLNLFIRILSGMVGVAVVAVIIIGGIQYSMSGGDAQAVAAAKKRISNALLALVIYAFSFAFLQWIIPGGIL